MVITARTGRIAKDPPAAMAFAVEMTNFIKGKYNSNASCFARVGGPVGEIGWQLVFEDMAALEKFNQAILSDQEYWKKLKGAQDQELFDPGSFEDSIWRQLS